MPPLTSSSLSCLAVPNSARRGSCSVMAMTFSHTLPTVSNSSCSDGLSSTALLRSRTSATLQGRGQHSAWCQQLTTASAVFGVFAACTCTRWPHTTAVPEDRQHLCLAVAVEQAVELLQAALDSVVQDSLHLFVDPGCEAHPLPLHVLPIRLKEGVHLSQRVLNLLEVCEQPLLGLLCVCVKQQTARGGSTELSSGV